MFLYSYLLCCFMSQLLDMPTTLTVPKSRQTSRRMLSLKSACMHPLNYMITLKQNHRSSERGESFGGSVAHVIAVLILHFGSSACSSLCVIWPGRAKSSLQDGVSNARAQFSNSCPPPFGSGLFALMQSGVKRKQKRG